MSTSETRAATVARHEIFQTSVMSALLDGVYDDELTVAELLTHGNFGIGTFNALDGEMVILDGECFQLRSDGTVSMPSPEARTPYAVITEFVPGIRRELPDGSLRSDASTFIDHMTVSENYMYALRITGDFEWVRTRTVVKQSKPYRPMVEATDDDAVVRFDDVRGTVVGFRTPLYETGISVPGCHAHFIDDSRSQGGHVLDFKLRSGVAELCLATDLHLRLPMTPAFREANLAPDDLDAQLQKTEMHR
ncbi:acetolactate decarboxylase [Leifsonia sp. A12D58]|uniref:acetolactate decarboxylase n=1 Tax=Leifsonia sp. A12D58 TaxID=3397674 RepID=UPI0039DFC918